MAKLAGIGEVSRDRLGRVLQQHSGIITSASVVAVLSVSSKEASRILSRWHQSGWIQRVKRGAYIPIPLEANNTEFTLAEPFMIANSLYKDGYIGGFSAIKHWDLSEQIIETTYYFTTKQVKNHSPTHGSFNFRIKTINPEKIFGVKNIWYGSQKINVSDLSKTIVDILDDPKLVGGMTIVYDIFKEYCESDYCDFQKLLQYSKKMNNKTILKRLGFMLATKFKTIPAELQGLDKEISAGYSMYDPLLNCNSIVEKWKLKVPESWKREYDRKK